MGIVTWFPAQSTVGKVTQIQYTKTYNQSKKYQVMK